MMHGTTNIKLLQSVKNRIVELSVFQTMVVNFDRQTAIGVLNTATVGKIHISVSEMKFKVWKKE